jgi:anti-sigma B factor antagonist
MGKRLPLRVVTDARNGIVRMALSGELDMATVDLFTDALSRCERGGAATVMLDLRDLSFMDSTGLHAFLKARDRSLGNGHRLLFVGASGPVRTIFEVTGVESVLDEHEAVTTLDQFTRQGNEPAAVGKAGDPHA